MLVEDFFPKRRGVISPARRERWQASAFDQSDFSGARTFAGFLGREFHALALTQELEHGTAHRASVKEVFDSAFVADEPEALVDQKSSDRSRWHTRVLR
jgi:hypothetical protein